ncbi:MAG: hypothetical protein JWQ43_2452 [Glaciihabitans sp.]|nr:hypothetical protein [Glaciihabitans sp.]
MGEFVIRVATPADVDRLWPLLAEAERHRILARARHLVERSERRRTRLVAQLLDIERPVLIAYSGIRAVGFLALPGREPYASESWRGLGVEQELLDFLA